MNASPCVRTRTCWSSAQAPAEPGAQPADPHLVEPRLAQQRLHLRAVGEGESAPVRDAEQAHAHRLLGQAPVDVTIKADRELPYEVIKQLTVQLEKRRARGVLRTYATGVTERTE